MINNIFSCEYKLICVATAFMLWTLKSFHSTSLLSFRADLSGEESGTLQIKEMIIIPHKRGPDSRIKNSSKGGG
jgi:hypothetical protein